MNARWLVLVTLVAAASLGCGDDGAPPSSKHSALTGAPPGQPDPGTYAGPASDAGTTPPVQPPAAPNTPPDPNTPPPDPNAPPANAQACSFNGQNVDHGGSVTAYRESIVSAAQGCTGETRTCNDGTLSGSFTNAECTVGANPSGYKCVTMYAHALITDHYAVVASWSNVPDLATCVLLCQSRTSVQFSGCNYIDATFADPARRNTCRLTAPFGALVGGNPGSFAGACH